MQEHIGSYHTAHRAEVRAELPTFGKNEKMVSNCQMLTAPGLEDWEVRDPAPTLRTLKGDQRGSKGARSLVIEKQAFKQLAHLKVNCRLFGIQLPG